MENKKSGHISEKELDGLLNEAFLSLDFETNSRDKEVLTVVTENAMGKSSLSRFFTAKRLNTLFLLLSIFLFLISFYHYIDSLTPLKYSSSINSALPKKISNTKTQQLISNTTQAPENRISFSILKNKEVSANKDHPKRTASKGNRNPKKVAPVKSSQAEDSLLAAVISELDITKPDSLPVEDAVNPLTNVSKEKAQASRRAAAKREVKPLNKTEASKSRSKSKVGRTMRAKFMSWLKKKKRKDKKFLKSSVSR